MLVADDRTHLHPVVAVTDKTGGVVGAIADGQSLRLLSRFGQEQGLIHIDYQGRRCVSGLRHHAPSFRSTRHGGLPGHEM
jgi:hypothetical protein